MKILMKTTLLFSLAAIFFGVCVMPRVSNAAGILSETINVDNARRGQTHWEELLFMNSEGKAITFALSAEGTIAKWAEFYLADDSRTPITRLEVPANSSLGAKVKFTIPENAANGKYQGLVIGTTLISSAEMSGEAVAQITQRLDREVNITITDNQNLDFNTIFTPIAYSMAKNEPFKVKIIHENRGNVDIKPDVELRVSRDGGEIFKAVFPYPDGAAAIQPNERKEIGDQVEWRTIGYEAGKYNVVLSAFENGQLSQKEEFVITVGANNSGAGMFGASLSGFLGGKTVMYLILAVIALIAAAGVILFKKKIIFVKK